MINGSQIAAGRALMKWTQAELAEKSGVHLETIKKIESGRVDAPRQTTIQKIRNTFERAGVEFIEGGVRERPDSIRVLYGREGITFLMEDIISTLKHSDDRILRISGADEHKFIRNYDLNLLMKYIEIREKHGIKQRLLLCEGDTNFVVANRQVYRWAPSGFFVEAPTFVYQDKVAALLWGVKTQIVIIQNSAYAEARAREYDVIWERAKEIPGQKSA